MVMRSEFFENLVQTIANVGSHGFVRTQRIAAAECIGKGGVELLGLRSSLRRHIIKPVEDEDLFLLDGLAQSRAACQLSNPHMELHVIRMDRKHEPGVCGFLCAHLLQLIEVLRAGAQLLLFFGRDALRTEPSRLGFEGFTDDITVANILLARYTHTRADPGTAFDQSFCFQTPQSFSNGEETHVELLGQAPAGQDIADRKVALQYLFANLLICPIRKRVSADFQPTSFTSPTVLVTVIAHR